MRHEGDVNTGFTPIALSVILDDHPADITSDYSFPPFPSMRPVVFRPICFPWNALNIFFLVLVEDSHYEKPDFTS